LIGKFVANSIVLATVSGFCMIHPVWVMAQSKLGIAHTALLRTELANSGGKEVVVWDTEYEPGAINARHLHPSAITFYVVSGTGVWLEDGKQPITLRAGDSLFVSAGTIHSHWNASSTERLRFLEFIAADRGKERAIPLPRRTESFDIG
jgi:quercetin dioxygenase-like cupin family protein